MLVEPWGSPVAEELVAELSADLTERYGVGPAGEGHETDDADPGVEAQTEVDLEMAEVRAADVQPPRGTFVVAWLEVDGGDRTPVGCGAIRPSPFADAAEIKRMYVRPEARGQGAARAVLDALGEHAEALGYRRLVLETGDAQPEAIALYESEGFTPIERFGAFRASPLSRCYERPL